MKWMVPGVLKTFENTEKLERFHTVEPTKGQTVPFCSLASVHKYTLPHLRGWKIDDVTICYKILDFITHITFSSCRLFYSVVVQSWRGNWAVEQINLRKNMHSTSKWENCKMKLPIFLIKVSLQICLMMHHELNFKACIFFLWEVYLKTKH